MRNDLFPRIKSATLLGAALLAGGPGFAAAQEAKVAPPPARPGAAKDAKAEMISGVIVKAEKVPAADAKAAEGAPMRLVRLTINPNAVWRDWARDQAKARDEGSPRKDAAKGEQSVATLGQPADQDNVVVVVVTDATKVETRFRSPSDETTKGEVSPDAVKSEDGAKAKSKSPAKPVQFRAADLLPGLFVEAEFRESAAAKGDAASTIAVIRPIEVPEPAARPGGAAPK